MDSKCIANKIPAGTSPERRRGLLFRLAGSNVSQDDALIAKLGSLNIDHTTEFQSHAEWIRARQFSLTSSGVDRQVSVQLKIDKERDERRAHWVKLEQYLSTSCGIEDSNGGGKC